MTSENSDKDHLESAFAAARAMQPKPSDALMARIVEDAATMQSAAIAPEVNAPRKGRFAMFLDAVGGWPAMSGFVAATAAGLWLGIDPPAPVENLTLAYLGTDFGSYVIDTSAEQALGFIDEEGQ